MATWCRYNEELFNPSTEEIIATTCTDGLDFDAAFAHARTIGGPALRAMTFAERGALLTQMAAVLHERREYLLEVSRDCNGATRGDSKFDVDGATGTLSTYGRYGAKMGDGRFQWTVLRARLLPMRVIWGNTSDCRVKGLPLHQCLNFPAWGAFEKIACISGGYARGHRTISTTALLTYEMVKIIVEADFLPAGTLSFIAGDSAGGSENLRSRCGCFYWVGHYCGQVASICRCSTQVCSFQC